MQSQQDLDSAAQRFKEAHGGQQQQYAPAETDDKQEPGAWQQRWARRLLPFAACHTAHDKGCSEGEGEAPVSSRSSSTSGGGSSWLWAAAGGSRAASGLSWHASGLSTISEGGAVSPMQCIPGAAAALEAASCSEAGCTGGREQLQWWQVWPAAKQAAAGWLSAYRALVWREALGMTRNPSDVAGRMLTFTWVRDLGERLDLGEGHVGTGRWPCWEKGGTDVSAEWPPVPPPCPGRADGGRDLLRPVCRCLQPARPHQPGLFYW